MLIQWAMTPCPKGSSQEELPHVRGQGQWPRVPNCKGAGTAERSYPTSEIRGSDKRSYPVSEVRGVAWEELTHAPKPEARGSGGRSYPTPPHVGVGPGGATALPRPGAVAGRTNPTPKETWLHKRRRA